MNQIYNNRLALAKTLQSLGPWTFSLTWNFNRDYNNHQQYNFLNEFDKRINRLVHGKRHHLLSDNNRILFVAVKASKSNPHYHGVIRISENNKIKFTENAARIWQHIVPPGSLHIGLEPNTQEWSSYVAFNDNWQNHSDEYFISSQFRP